MAEQIQVVGLTTTDVVNGVQYTILTKTGDTHYDYVFMPMSNGKYVLRITPKQSLAFWLPVNQWCMPMSGIDYLPLFQKMSLY